MGNFAEVSIVSHDVPGKNDEEHELEFSSPILEEGA